MNDKLTEEAKQQINDRIDALMTHLAPDADTPTHGTLQKKYLSNRSHAVAADQALQSVTSAAGFQHFCAEKQVGRLADNEYRYTIPFAELPPEVQDVSKGMTKRFAILDTKTQETRLEVAWGAPKPSLWAVTDGGADTWHHRLKLYYKYGLRGSEKYDPPHRSVRVRDRTINGADGGWVKSEFGLIFKYVRGPWQSEANFQLIKGGANELFGNFDHQFPIFRFYIYPRICDLRYSHCAPSDYGSDAHVKHIWQDIQSDPILTGLSDEYSPNRWRCWTQRFGFYWGSFDILLLICLYILVSRGVTKNLLRDFPELHGVAKWAEGFGVDYAVDHPVEMDIKNLKAASKALEMKRCKGSSSLLVVAESLCNLTTRRLGYAVANVPNPIEDKMMKDLDQNGTQVGSKEWHINQARGASLVYIKEMLGMLENGEFLHKMKFLTPKEVVGPKSLTEDNGVAKFVFDLAKHGAINEGKTMSFYRDRPPYKFF